jgi:hypothetical protein
VSYGYNHGRPASEVGADAVIDRLDQLDLRRWPAVAVPPATPARRNH